MKLNRTAPHAPAIGPGARERARRHDCMHRCTRTHAHARRSMTQAQAQAQAHARTQARKTRKHTQVRKTRTHTQARLRTRTCARASTHARSHPRARARTRTRRGMRGASGSSRWNICRFSGCSPLSTCGAKGSSCAAARKSFCADAFAEARRERGRGSARSRCIDGWLRRIPGRMSRPVAAPHHPLACFQASPILHSAQ